MADLEHVVDAAQFRLWLAALSHAGVLSVLHLGSGGDDDLIVERGHERAPLTVDAALAEHVLGSGHYPVSEYGKV